MNLNEKTDVKYADTFFKRFMGLMGKKDIDYVLVFTNLKDSSIHTHFMRFDIDVYFLGEDKVVFEKATLKPWKFHRPEKRAKFIIETKRDALKIEVGDELEFV